MTTMSMVLQKVAIAGAFAHVPALDGSATLEGTGGTVPLLAETYARPPCKLTSHRRVGGLVACVWHRVGGSVPTDEPVRPYVMATAIRSRC